MATNPDRKITVEADDEALIERLSAVLGSLEPVEFEGKQFFVSAKRRSTRGTQPYVFTLVATRR